MHDANDHPGQLSEREMRILDFEARPWQRAAAKEEAIAQEFGVSVTTYYQVLTHLLRNPQAAQYAPMTVRRLLSIASA